jgi:ATP-binding cassette subfamily B protein
MSEKTKVNNVYLIRKTLHLLRENRLVVLFILVLVLLLALISPLRPMLIQNMVDGPIKQGDSNGMLRYTLWMIGLLMLESLFRYYFTYQSAWLGQAVVRQLRQKLFHHLSTLRVSYYDRTPVGTLTTRTISDIESIAEVFSQGLLTIWGDLLQLLVLLAIMFYTDWRLTLIGLIVLPPLLWATWLFKEKVRTSYQEVRREVARLNTIVQEHLTGMGIIQVFNREKESMNTFRMVNHELQQSHLRGVLYYSVFFPVVEILTAVSLGLVVSWGALQAIGGGVSQGVFIAFILYLNQFFRPIRLLADKFNSLQMGVVAAERVFKLMEIKEQEVDGGQSIPVSSQGSVLFRNVYFSYRPDLPVLRGVSFELKPGKRLALVGSTGSGKTSVVNVLGRFYTHSAGEVYVDGMRIEEMPLSELRGRIGFILQDVFLFAGSVFENISLKDSSVSRNQIRDIARQAGIYRFLERLPGELDYEVGERGVALSTGQRQLIAFLRMMVLNPPLVVLDEATASVDSETESLLQYALNSLLANRSALVVAHRLSTVHDADEILVLEKGEIVERGTHTSLLETNGVYSRLYRLQFESQLLNS